MTLNLTPTRKDKPLFGFLKAGPPTRVGETARRVSGNLDRPASQEPLFRTSRTLSSEAVTRP